MDGYVARVIFKYGHPSHNKTQLSPHKHCELIYSAKQQLTSEDNTTLPLNSQEKKHVQGIIGALLYYAGVMDEKLLVGLSSIRSHQAAAIQRTNDTINQILDYCATYPKG